MRIRAFPALEPREGQVRHLRRVRHDAGHNGAHVQLRPQGYHVCCEVGPVPDEIVPHLFELVRGVVQRLLGVRRSPVESMDVVRRIVRTVLGPPEHGDAPQSDVVGNALVRANKLGAVIVFSRRVSLLDPRRAPRHVVDRTRRLLAFVRPVHRRGSHVPPD